MTSHAANPGCAESAETSSRTKASLSLSNGNSNGSGSGSGAGGGGGGGVLPGEKDVDDVLVGKTHEGTREFLGLIDEVRIWNRELSQKEVKEHMNMGYDELFAVDPRQRLTTTWGAVKKL